MRMLLAALALCLVPALAAAESYTAVSTTAMGITGDIKMDDYGISFANGEKLVFSDLVSYELSVDGKTAEADVYKVETPADPVLQNGNRFCGSGAVTHVARWKGSDGLTIVAAFATPGVPARDDQMCASYTYE